MVLAGTAQRPVQLHLIGLKEAWEDMIEKGSQEPDPRGSSTRQDLEWFGFVLFCFEV